MIDFESPLFIDILLYAIYALIAVAIGLSVWSAIRSARQQTKEDGRSNGLPVRKIVFATLALLLLSLLLTYLLASTQPLSINGQTFADTFWLRISDMFIYTSLILIVVALIGAAIGYSGISRAHPKSLPKGGA